MPFLLFLLVIIAIAAYRRRFPFVPTTPAVDRSDIVADLLGDND